MREELIMGAKPFQVRPHYQLIYGPDWHEHEDGRSINSELLQRMRLLVDYLFEHQMVTGNIRFNEGVRSPRRAHIMSTSWFLRQPEGQEPSKIPLGNNPKTGKGVEPWHIQLDPYRK